MFGSLITRFFGSNLISAVSRPGNLGAVALDCDLRWSSFFEHEPCSTIGSYPLLVRLKLGESLLHRQLTGDGTASYCRGHWWLHHRDYGQIRLRQYFD